ncbi:MAG: 23S rRNA (adenine(2503)-C(2))-methyltransferase RlmN, partial [Deltaproteobacteria bacterium]
MRDIKDLNIDELEPAFKEWGVAAFRTRQVFDWVYKKGVSDFTQMSNLPLELRKRLKENFCLLSSRIIDKLRSQDGTEKLLFELSDKNVIEAVNIPAQNRVTACLSTQVGCRFSCGFCASGLLGFKRNLSCGEMLEELCYLKNNSKDKKVTHVVFMGTGEPFDNYGNVLKAIRAINAEWGFNIGSRRITVSTNGIIPGIEKLSREGLQVELSVSLHAADEKTRSYL